jgi:hypothetical protein
MNEPTQEAVKRKGQAPVFIATVLLFACVLLMLGFAGTIYLWLNEKTQSVIDAEDYAKQVQAMRVDIQTAEQTLEQKRIQLADQESALRLDVERQAREQQASIVKQQGVINRTAFITKQPKLEPPGYPQPIRTERWTGDLLITDAGPARYALPSQGLALIKPDQSHTPDQACAPFALNQDGSKFFIIDSQSILRRFDSNTLKEEVSLEVGQKCYDMVLTAGGLALSFPGRSAVWMIDPDQMTVLGEVPLKFANHLAATPTSERVYAIGHTQAIGFDPKTLQIDRSLHFNEQGVLAGAQHFFNNRIHSFAMHPDNEHLYTAYGAGMGLHRFSITPTGIRYVSSASAKPRSDFSTLAISHDGKWMTMPHSGPTYVFETNETNTARLRLTADGSITACQFDPATGKIVAAVKTRSNNLHLNVYTSTGELDRTYWLLLSGIEITRIEALPVGQRYIVWTEYGMRVIDLLTERITAQIPRQDD